MHTNTNFPAPLAVMAVLAAGAALIACAVATLCAVIMRRRTWLKSIGALFGTGVGVYAVLLIGFSVASRETTLPVGEEKHFCEIDCHLAYSVESVTTSLPASSGTDRYVIALRTRFDETTISAGRSREAPLAPSPRDVFVLAGSGLYRATQFRDRSEPLSRQLRPGESYVTRLAVELPAGVLKPRLAVITRPIWLDRFVIGDENSLGHKKTYFALER